MHLPLRPGDRAHAYKIEYYDGVAGGHARQREPRTAGVGLPRQHRPAPDVLRRRDTLGEVDRVSTLRFEVDRRRHQGSTHVVWLDEHAAGDRHRRGLLAVRPEPADKAERSGAARRQAAARHEADRVGTLPRLRRHGPSRPRRGPRGRRLRHGDRRTARRDPAAHHLLARGLRTRATTCSTRCRSGCCPQDGRDWHEWGMAYLKEYVYEIDAETGQVLRHWSAGQDTPAHINSDVCISDRELIYCNGGSGDHRDDRPGELRLVPASSTSAPGCVEHVRAGRQGLRRRPRRADPRLGAAPSSHHFIARCGFHGAR